jgi:septal ring factor EnvC (AmiA/AmiB activator)
VALFPKYITLVILVVVAETIYASPQDEIKKHQSELQSIRDQIQEFEEKIKEQQQTERATLEMLDTYDRNASLLGRLITKLRAAEQKLQSNIEATRAEISDLEDQLMFLKKHYANYISSVYKSGRIHDLELLLSSRSINQFYIRAEYLRSFSEQRKKDAGKIIEKKKEIEEIEARLQLQLSEQRRLIAEKGAEEDRLADLVSDRKDVLFQVRKDKKNISRELRRKLEAAKEVENLITILIEAERVRKERETGEILKGELPQPPRVAGTFESKKGKLRWPVSSGSVVARFGNHTHPTLKTVTQNPGIDIAVGAGAPVTAVAVGTIARIWWMVSYGNLVIIDHSDGYRTIYTHLADIRVTEDQQVKEGDVVGTSGETLAGPLLHFQLWKDREKQNPEIWLSKR